MISDNFHAHLFQINSSQTPPFCLELQSPNLKTHIISLKVETDNVPASFLLDVQEQRLNIMC